VHIVRNGSRGLFWLEPLVEVATPAGRVAYGPVAPSDVPGCSTRAWPRAAHTRCATGRPALFLTSRASSA
jgi:formate dehydrogenase iron-sulfur subunit